MKTFVLLSVVAACASAHEHGVAGGGDDHGGADASVDSPTDAGDPPTHAAAACHVTSPTAVGGTEYSAPIIAWTGTEHLFVARDVTTQGYPMIFVRYAQDGTRTGKTTLGAGGTAAVYPVAAALASPTSLGLVVTNAQNQAQFQTIDPTTGVSSMPTAITTNASFGDSRMLWNGADYVINWDGVAGAGIARITPAAALLSPTPSVTTWSDPDGSIAWSGSEIGYVGNCPDATQPLGFSRIAPDGTLLTPSALDLPEVTADPDHAPTESVPSATAMVWTGSAYVIAYLRRKTNTVELVSVSPSGVKNGPPVVVDSDIYQDANGVDLAWNGHDLAVAWSKVPAGQLTPDVYVRRYSSALVAHAPATKVTDNSHRQYDHASWGARHVRIVWSDDEYTVVYNDYAGAATPQLYFQSVCD